jgi:hypothetical protein
MSIELLYIIPAVALSLLVLINIIMLQRKAAQRAPDQHLHKEVEEFNTGRVAMDVKDRQIPEARLGEIERTVTLVSQALSSQHKLIEGFQGSNAGHTAEIDALKSRLREMQREYDIILSENYSLRAKIRKLEERPPEPDVMAAGAAAGGGADQGAAGPAGVTRDELLYADTKLLSDLSLDDTTELDILLNRDMG